MALLSAFLWLSLVDGKRLQASWSSFPKGNLNNPGNVSRRFRLVDGKRLQASWSCTCSLGIYIVRSTNRSRRETLGAGGFRVVFECHLHGGTLIFLVIYMGEHYSLRGEMLAFLIIYMGELSWTVLERSWVGLGRPWDENSANRHVNGSKHLHGGMLLGRSLRLLKGFIKGFKKLVQHIFK